MLISDNSRLRKIFFLIFKLTYLSRFIFNNVCFEDKNLTSYFFLCTSPFCDQYINSLYVCQTRTDVEGTKYCSENSYSNFHLSNHFYKLVYLSIPVLQGDGYDSCQLSI